MTPQYLITRAINRERDVYVYRVCGEDQALLELSDGWWSVHRKTSEKTSVRNHRKVLFESSAMDEALEYLLEHNHMDEYQALLRNV